MLATRRTAMISIDTPKDEKNGAAEIEVAKKIKITVKTYSPVVRSASKLGLMRVQTLTFDRPTTRTFTARVFYKFLSKVSVRI